MGRQLARSDRSSGTLARSALVANPKCGCAGKCGCAAKSGAALDTRQRAFMEPRFGFDFGQVRIHDDAHAAESARSLNANAYTVGDDIVFAGGKYAPDTRAGQRLLAHE